MGKPIFNATVKKGRGREEQRYREHKRAQRQRGGSTEERERERERERDRERERERAMGGEGRERASGRAWLLPGLSLPGPPSQELSHKARYANSRQMPQQPVSSAGRAQGP